MREIYGSYINVLHVFYKHIINNNWNKYKALLQSASKSNINSYCRLSLAIPVAISNDDWLWKSLLKCKRSIFISIRNVTVMYVNLFDPSIILRMRQRNIILSSLSKKKTSRDSSAIVWHEKQRQGYRLVKTRDPTLWTRSVKKTIIDGLSIFLCLDVDYI